VEARRAVKDLGAAGVLIYTDVAGKPLDDSAFEMRWITASPFKGQDPGPGAAHRMLARLPRSHNGR
jgi:hypothetical protein